MDTTLCDLANPPTSSGQSQWDLMFEQSLEALCESLNVLGNIDSSIMRNYTRKTKEDRSPGARQTNQGHVLENASIDSSGYLSSDSSTDTLVPSQNSENIAHLRSISVTNGNSFRGNKDNRRENGWRSRLDDQYNSKCFIAVRESSVRSITPHSLYGYIYDKSV